MHLHFSAWEFSDEECLVAAQLFMKKFMEHKVPLEIDEVYFSKNLSQQVAKQPFFHTTASQSLSTWTRVMQSHSCNAYGGTKSVDCDGDRVDTHMQMHFPS